MLTIGFALYAICRKLLFSWPNLAVIGDPKHLSGEKNVITRTNRPNRVRLGNFTYDLEQGCLLDAAEDHVSLRPQSAQILAILVENIGETVTKESLISTVWENVSVTDDSLTQCISDVRRALGDRDRRILQTRPKVGYLLYPTQQNADSHQVAAQKAVFDVPATQSSAKSAWVHIETDNSVNTQHSVDASTLENDAASKGSNRLIRSNETTAVFEFTDVFAALRFALGLTTSPNRQIYRIGVDLVKKERADAMNKIMGTVNVRVANLVSLAQAAEIVVSIDVRDECYGELDFEFEDLGHQTIPNGKNAVRAFRIGTANTALRILPNITAEDVLPTIAIIPLVPRIEAPDTSVIGEIIADDLILAISQSADINVISRLSTTLFRTKTVNLDKMGTVLGTDFVLSGTFITQGPQVAMMLEFSEVSTNKVLWSERVEVDIATLLSGVGAIDDVVSKIRKAIALNEVKRARSNPISTLRNYTLLIGAVGLMHRLGLTDFELAGDMLKALIERSPNQPAALSWMARWHVLRVQQGWSDEPQKEAQLALACSTKALDIDPENALALTSEGFVLTNLLHKLDEAEDRYDAALESNPNDANGRLLRGTLFAFQGMGKEAKRDSERALHLAPLDPHRFFFLALAASANIAAEDYERAIVLAKASLRMNRTHTSTLRVKAVAQMRLGDEEAARETTRELMRLQPNLSVSAWLKNSPSASFEVGRQFAKTLRETGVPE